MACLKTPMPAFNQDAYLQGIIAPVYFRDQGGLIFVEQSQRNRNSQVFYFTLHLCSLFPDANIIDFIFSFCKVLFKIRKNHS